VTGGYHEKDSNKIKEEGYCSKNTGYGIIIFCISRQSARKVIVRSPAIAHTP